MQVGFKDINPRFSELESSGINIPRHTTAWNHSKTTPRRAMLNNFGAAGSNTSLLLEESANQPSNPFKHQERSAYVFALSAKSQIALQVSVQRYLDFLGKPEHHPPLKDICYTATARRQIHEHRIAIVCASIDELRGKLDRFKHPVQFQHRASRLLYLFFLDKAVCITVWERSSCTHTRFSKTLS
jgi:acyl transferase domain-containing protein